MSEWLSHKLGTDISWDENTYIIYLVTFTKSGTYQRNRTLCKNCIQNVASSVS